MIEKMTDINTALNIVKSGDTIMVGGFTLSGCPINLLKKLAEKSVNDLTAISEDVGYANDIYNNAVTSLFENETIKKICVSFIGSNELINKLINEGKLTYELIPQGTLAERIRIAGSGIGGFYTPTGIGTVAEEGKEKRLINGQWQLLELPLYADVALIKAYKADHMGNAVFKYSAQNFNPLMAMAATTVILEVEKVVEFGEIETDEVQLPGVFIDHIVLCNEE